MFVEDKTAKLVLEKCLETGGDYAEIFFEDTTILFSLIPK